MLIIKIVLALVILNCILFLSVPIDTNKIDRLMCKIYKAHRHHGLFYWQPTLTGLIIFCAATILVISLFQGEIIGIIIGTIVTILVMIEFIKSVKILKKMNRVIIK